MGARGELGLEQRRYPWGEEADGEANLAGDRFAPAAVGSYPDGASADGVQQLLGDVWEWTASDFTAYPGFEAFPYDEYSKVFFGSEYKVLRGGSWATHPLARALHLPQLGLPDPAAALRRLPVRA